MSKTIVCKIIPWIFEIEFASETFEMHCMYERSCNGIIGFLKNINYVNISGNGRHSFSKSNVTLISIDNSEIAFAEDSENNGS